MIAGGRLRSIDRKLICQLCDYLRNSLCTLHSQRVIHPGDTSLGSTWSTAFGNVIVVCFLYGNKHVLDPESIFGLVCNDLSARCGAVSVYIWQYFICSVYTSSCRVLHSCTAFQRPSRVWTLAQLLQVILELKFFGLSVSDFADVVSKVTKRKFSR